MDPTIDFAKRLEDPARWKIIANVPVFDEHEEEVDEPVLDEKGEPILGADGKPKKRKVRIKFGPEELQRHADNCNKLVAGGNPPGLVIGHTKDDAPEDQQPVTVGFGKNYRVAKFGPEQRLGIIHDEWYYPDKYEAALTYPYRSVERWPKAEIFKPVSLLRREPKRILGVVTNQAGERRIRYAMAEQVVRYGAKPMKESYAAMCRRHAAEAEEYAAQCDDDHTPVPEAEETEANAATNLHRAAEFNRVASPTAKPLRIPKNPTTRQPQPSQSFRGARMAMVRHGAEDMEPEPEEEELRDEDKPSDEEIFEDLANKHPHMKYAAILPYLHKKYAAEAGLEEPEEEEEAEQNAAGYASGSNTAPPRYMAGSKKAMWAQVDDAGEGHRTEDKQYKDMEGKWHENERARWRHQAEEEVMRYAAMERDLAELREAFTVHEAELQAARDGERVARYARDLGQLNQTYSFDLDTEIRYCAGMEDKQFAEHKAIIVRNYNRYPIGHGPIRIAETEDPLGGEDKPFTREQYEAALKYQAEHPNATPQEAQAKVRSKAVRVS